MKNVSARPMPEERQRSTFFIGFESDGRLGRPVGARGKGTKQRASCSAPSHADGLLNASRV